MPRSGSKLLCQPRLFRVDGLGRHHLRLARGGGVGAAKLDLYNLARVCWLGDGQVMDCVEVPMRNRLKVLRAERDWSQAQLADQVGVSRQTINAVETGKYDPSLPLAFKLAQTFGVPIQAIFEPPEDGLGG